jgi:CRP-like cAMP-binding protein
MSVSGFAIDLSPSTQHPAEGPASTAHDLAALLATMPVLQDIYAGTLDSLAAGARLIEYEPGKPVFGRGSAPTGLFFVVDGSVKLVAQGADARSRVVELFERGRMFGEIGVFTGERYRTWTETVAQTTLLHVGKACVLDAVATDHALCQRMLRTVTARIQRLIDGIGVTSPTTADVRVAAYLLELAERAEPAAQWLTLPAPKGTIASLLNLNRESLSRALRRMIDAGLLRVAGRRIRICAPEQLLAMTTPPAFPDRAH